MKIRTMLLPLLLAVFGLGSARAGDVTLSWTAPTTNTDSSALTDLAGFKVYRGTSSSALSFLANDTASPYADAGLAPGTYWYTVTAVNALGAESAKPAPISATIAAAAKVPNPPNSLAAVVAQPPASGVRDNPGFYIGSGAVLSTLTGDNLAWKLAEIKGEIDRYLTSPSVKGFHFRITWDVLEHTRGVYDFSQLDGLVAYLHAKFPGKLWSVEIWNVKFSSSAPTGFIPAYLANEPDSAGGWTYDAVLKASKANTYKASIMSRQIALYQAFAAHYAGDVTLAKMHTEESSFNFTTASGWTAANELAQMDRYYVALAAVQSSTGALVCAEANYFVSEARTEQLVALIHAKGLCIGGPDTFGRSGYNAHPTDGNYVTWAQLVTIGKHWNGTTWVDTGGFDYRRTTVLGFQIEEPELVGYAGSTPGSPYTFADIYDMSHNVLANNYTTVCTTPTVYGVNSTTYKISDEAVAYIVANGLTTRPTVH